MKFADLHEGLSLRLGPVTLSQDEILEFARRHDPQWFHTDVERAAGPPWHGLIASGWQSCTIAMTLAARAVFDGSESIGAPGIDYLKWPNPVRPGDTLMATIDVLDARRSRSKSHLGIVKWRWRLHNQHEAEVLDLAVTTLYDLSGGPATAPG